MDMINILPGLIRNKALNYKISKTKYKILVNIFKNHSKMSDGELISHLQFVYDMIYPINVARDILNNYSNPQSAFFYYKKGFTYLKPQEKKANYNIKFPFRDNILLFSSVIAMFTFLFIGGISLMLLLTDYIPYITSNKILLAITGLGLTFLMGLFVSDIQLSMYSAKKFKNLEKSKKKTK